MTRGALATTMLCSSTAAMLLIISDWLVMAGNHGSIDSTRDSHLQQESHLLLDTRYNMAGSNWDQTGQGGDMTTEQMRLHSSSTTSRFSLRQNTAPRISRFTEQPISSPATPAHEPSTNRHFKQHPRNQNDLLTPDDREGTNIPIASSQKPSTTVPSAMLKPLYKVHLDTSTLQNKDPQPRIPHLPSFTPSTNSKVPKHRPLRQDDSQFQSDENVKAISGNKDDISDDAPVQFNRSISENGKAPRVTNATSLPPAPAADAISYSNPLLQQASAITLKPSILHESSGASNTSFPKPTSTSGTALLPSQTEGKVHVDQHRPQQHSSVTAGLPLLRKGLVCETFQKRCDNGMCVAHVLPCPQKSCPQHRPYQCGNKWQCLTFNKRCDDKQDCDDGSDEAGCDAETYPYSHNRRVIVVSTIIVIVLGMSLFCCVLIHVYRNAQLSDRIITRNRIRRQSSGMSPIHPSPSSQNHANFQGHSAAPWSNALLRLRHLLGIALETASAASSGAPRSRSTVPLTGASASVSFHSMSSSVTQPFLPPGRSTSGGHSSRAVQSETLQSFLSAAGSEPGNPNAEEDSPLHTTTTMDEDQRDEDTGSPIASRTALQVTLSGLPPDPPPPYEEVVNMATLEEQQICQGSNRANQSSRSASGAAVDGAGTAGFEERGPPPTYESIFCIEV